MHGVPEGWHSVSAEQRWKEFEPAESFSTAGAAAVQLPIAAINDRL
jgi:hypothetical protein